MKPSLAVVVVTALLGVALPRVAEAQLVLRNDSFETGMQVGVQAGFVAGEMGASRFVAPSAGRTLQKVTLFFGGAMSTQTVTLRVYDDSAGAASPGGVLFEGDYDVMGSDTALSELAIPGTVTVPATFRVAIEFKHAGVPSIARDDDGNAQAGRNFLYAQGLGWVEASAVGVNGDWILRATVSDSGGGGGDAGVTPDAGATPDAGGGGGGGGGACAGNNDCSLGSYCDPASHACTFDCRTAEDCGGETCNSLGQCVAAKGDGGGCCEAGGGGGPGALALGAVVAALALGAGRRRARGA